VYVTAAEVRMQSTREKQAIDLLMAVDGAL